MSTGELESSLREDDQDQDQDQQQLDAMFDLSSKKKKSSKKKDKDGEPKKEKSKEKKSKEPKESTSDQQDKTDNAPENEEPVSPETEVEAMNLPTYSYDELLDRMFSLLEGTGNSTTTTVKPPQLSRLGTKKTLWSNFKEICQSLNRNPDHVFQYVMAELGTEGSFDGSQRVVIRGKFAQKHVESLLRRYIISYVQCQMCRSLDTELQRDGNTRLYFVACKKCKSTKSVSAIKAGFHAATKADRRAMRNA